MKLTLEETNKVVRKEMEVLIGYGLLQHPHAEDLPYFAAMHTILEYYSTPKQYAKAMKRLYG